MTLGTEWLIDASGCDADALADIERLRAVFSRVISDLDLNVVGEIAWATFPHPGGVSGLALLSESHLACHTYPEHHAATFNLYCCRNRPHYSLAVVPMDIPVQPAPGRIRGIGNEIPAFLRSHPS